ncbi:MAG: hypothetical protein NTV34_11650 [Proteobacteria bacterium]|nr:hypothetical protein [Pseudomonadota bacterium]
MSANKGNWSSMNVKAAAKIEVSDIGLKTPSNIKNTRLLPTKETQEKLWDRRAGIEPASARTEIAHGAGAVVRHRQRITAANYRRTKQPLIVRDFMCCYRCDLRSLGY